MAKETRLFIHRKNAPIGGTADLYYSLLRLSWPKLILSTLFFYLFVNFLFAIFYYATQSGLRPSNLSFIDSYLFSVHTFSTVGYSNILPISLVVQVVSILEIFSGLLFMALLTGLFFSKFSQPSARFLFSDKMLITSYRGKPALLFRIANARNNRVMDAEARLTVLFDEITPEKIRYRRLEDLSLDRDQTPVFALSFTCAHYIEPNSETEKLLARMHAGENIEFMVSIRGLDDTYGQTIHASKLYGTNQLHDGGQFEDILETHADGSRTIDFAKFNKLKLEG